MLHNKEDKKKLDEEILALFLFMLKYVNGKEFKSLLHAFKQHRELLKIEVNKVYAKYTKDGALKITGREISIEVNKIEKQLKTIGQDLRKQEDEILAYLLYKVYKDTYSKSTDILNKYIKVSNRNAVTLKDKTIKDSINKKIDDKTVYDRNKINKEKLISKVKNDIKQQLQKGSDIGLVNKTIDKTFGQGAYISERLLYTEVAREFNNSLLESYKNSGVKKVEFSAILDDRTTELCESLHGEIFNIADAPIPPLHVNCRSTILPVD